VEKEQPKREVQRPTPKEPKRPTQPKARPSKPIESKPAAPTATPRTRSPVAEKRKAAEPPPPKPKSKPKPKPVRPPQFAWAYPEEPPEADLKPLANAPAVDPEGRIVLHVQGRLVALREKEGHPEICWEYVTGSHAPGPTTVAPDGNIRLHCSDGLLHCVSFEGKQVWTPAGVGEPLGYAAPVVDQQGNTFISGFDGGLIKVDTKGKRQRPGGYFRSRQKFDAPGVVHQGVLYIGSEEGYVFAVRLDQRRGQNLWDHAAEQGHAGWYVRCWPALSEEGILIVAGRDEHLHGFTLDGKPAWKSEMPGQMLGSPVIDPHGHVYVGLSQARRGQEPRGALVCVDGNSHKIRWQYQAAGPVESTPVIGEDEVIYFGDNSGLVHAVDFRGKARWTAQFEAAVRSAGTILAPERVAFGLDNETLVVLKCSSKGLAEAGWPKIGKTLGQCGLS
jgi:outer membrane protein assembly factor BamB